MSPVTRAIFLLSWTPISDLCTLYGDSYWILFWNYLCPHFWRNPLTCHIFADSPLIIDGGFQYLGKWKSTNIRRLITGILSGIGTDFLIYEILFLGFTHGKQLTRYILAYF